MKESAVLFGEPKSLVGIVTDPVGEANGVGFIWLNAGFTHHVGPQRFYVRMARELSKRGFTSLRFDHSGIGDSPRRPDNLPFPDSVIRDSQDAMQFLHSTRGLERFVIGGICWGADNSIRICTADQRVVGVCAIDFYAVPSVRHLLRVYPPRLLTTRSWANLVRGRSGVFGAAKGLVNAAVKAVMARREEGDDVLPSLPPPAVVANLREMVDRGVHLCFAYATNAASYDQYMGRFRKPMAELEATGRLKSKVFPGADHLFTLRHNQSALMNFVLEWSAGVADHFGKSRNAPPEGVLSAE